MFTFFSQQSKALYTYNLILTIKYSIDLHTNNNEN